MKTTRWMLVSMVCLGAFHGCKTTQDQPTAESPRVERPPSPYPEADERTYTNLLARVEETPAPFDYDHDYTAPKNPRTPRTLEDLDTPKVPGATKEPEAPSSTPETPPVEPAESYAESPPTEEEDTTPDPISEYDYLEVELWRAAYDGTKEDFLEPYCAWMVDQKHMDYHVIEEHSDDSPLTRKDYIAYCKAHAEPTYKPFTSPTSPEKVSAISFHTTGLKATKQYARCENLMHQRIQAYMHPDHTDGPIPSTKGFPRALAKSQKLEATCRADEKAFLTDVLDDEQAIKRVLAELPDNEITYTRLKPVNVMKLGRALSRQLIKESDRWMHNYTCEEFLEEARHDEFISCTKEAGPHFTVKQPGIKTMRNFYRAYGWLSDVYGGHIWITKRDDMVAVLAVASDSPGLRGNNYDWYSICDDCEGHSHLITLYNARGEALMSFSESGYA